jgi:hypothetical protein
MLSIESGGEEQQYLKTYMAESLEKLEVVIEFLRKEETELPVQLEVQLPTPDTLPDLYSHRPVVIVLGNSSERDGEAMSSFTGTDKEAEHDRSSEDLVSLKKGCRCSRCPTLLFFYF